MGACVFCKLKEHGSQGPPGAGFVGSGDRNDKESALWIQQAESKIVGELCSEGACSDIGSKFSAFGKRLDVKRSDGSMKKKKETALRLGVARATVSHPWRRAA